MFSFPPVIHGNLITHTGIVVITDGVIGLPDATVFDSLLVQLRNQTIACSFLQLGSVFQPQRSFGYIPFTDLMNFLATATCGAYMPSLPPVVGVGTCIYIPVVLQGLGIVFVWPHVHIYNYP